MNYWFFFQLTNFVKSIILHEHVSNPFYFMFVHFIKIVLSVFLATLSMFLGALGAARFLHNNLVHKLIRAPMSFFDRTPHGRIINRCSHDVSEVDNDFPATLRAWASCIFTVFFFTFQKKHFFFKNFNRNFLSIS